MKRLATLILVGSLGASTILIGACATDNTASVAAVADHSATLKIEGMTCASCSVTVRAAVRKLDGLATIEVDVAGGNATVTFDSKLVTAEQIAKQITDAGYTTTVQEDGEV